MEDCRVGPCSCAFGACSFAFRTADCTSTNFCGSFTSLLLNKESLVEIMGMCLSRTINLCLSVVTFAMNRSLFSSFLHLVTPHRPLLFWLVPLSFPPCSSSYFLSAFSFCLLVFCFCLFPLACIFFGWVLKWEHAWWFASIKLRDDHSSEPTSCCVVLLHSGQLMCPFFILSFCFRSLSNFFFCFSPFGDPSPRCCVAALCCFCFFGLKASGKFEPNLFVFVCVCVCMCFCVCVWVFASGNICALLLLHQ